MKGLVIYDSYYGNTKLVAETIAEELRAEGHEAELRSVRDKYPAPPEGDLMFLGSPVRMGKTTKRIKRYVEGLDKSAWEEKPVVVFTTILALPDEPTPERLESREKHDIAAGRKLVELAKEEGLNALDQHLWVDVTGLKGPLVKAGVKQAKEFAGGILRTI